MSRTIVITQADGSVRQYGEHDLPLKLGSQADCHIILPGRAPVTAYIGDDHGHLFIQPAEDSAGTLLHNDRPLTESAWLKSNDQLRCDPFAVEYRRSGDRLIFSVAAAREAASPGLFPPPQPPHRLLAADNGADIPVEVDRPRKGGPGKKIAFGLIALSGLLLACAVMFVVLARPLQVQVTPEAETISITGFPPPVKIGSRYLGLPGVYTARISRQGYREYREHLVIGKERDNRLLVTLEKLPGILNLDVTPADGVAVFSGEALLGTTPPGRVEIGPGAHLLSLEKERYQPYRTEIVVEGGGVEQDLKVKLDPDWAEITITSEPAGADVLIDGAPAGLTPLTAELLSGNHQLVLSRELFVDHELTIEVQAGIDRDYRLTMEPLPGRLLLSSTPAGAVVTIDNEYRGVTPLTISLPSDAEQLIQLSHPGHKRLAHSLELSPGEERKLELRLEEETGIVYLATTPADAVVSINGEIFAGIQGELSLPAAPQRFDVSLPGYKSVSRTVTPNPGFSQRLFIDLVPESEGSGPLPEAAPPKKALVTPAGQRLVLIEPRPFTMGAPRREPGRRANERERKVVMTRPFLIGEKPVTNGDFKEFDSTHDSGAAGGFSLGADRQPVVNLTWNQAVEYLNWLSMQDDLPPFYVKEGDTYQPVSPPTNGYRLPTEAEWAYTARQAAERQDQRYPWPGGFPPRSVAANLADESARNIVARVISGYDDGFAVTAPVGSFPADKAGLYDIAGNVSEWCHDYYSAYTAALSDAPDPLGPPTGTHRVIRGSSWRDASLTETRLSYRSYHKEARNNVGFRVARYP